MCCEIASGLLATARCSWTGESCYEPVLGNIGLVLWAVLLIPVCAVGLCIRRCCEGQEMDRVVSEQLQRPPPVDLQYVRMS